MPVSAAPHHAAFHEMTGEPKNSLSGLRGYIEEIFAPPEVAVGEQNVPVGEYETCLCEWIGCRVERRGMSQR